jgi:hypothetical protein
MKFQAAFSNSDAKLSLKVQNQLKKCLARSCRDEEGDEGEANCTVEAYF